MSTRRLLLSLAGTAVLAGGFVLVARSGVGSGRDEPVAARPAPDFALDVRRFLISHCVVCHGAVDPHGKLNLDAIASPAQAAAAPSVWTRARRLVSGGEMPPVGTARPPKEAVERFLAWIDATIPVATPSPAASSGPGDPGRVTMRRLNRLEYRNTVRDLLGVDDRSSDGFPSDDVGYGFDDIGDVLSMPPLLVEKALQAAERLANEAIVVEDPAHPPARRFQAEALESTAPPGVDHGVRVLSSNGDVHGEVRLPRDGTYVLRARAFATQAGDGPAQLLFAIDAKGVAVFDVLATRREPKAYAKEVHLKGGVHRFSAAFPNDFYDPKNPDPERRDRNLFLDWVEIEGPVDPAPELPASHRRIFATDPGPDRPSHERALRILGPLATRAWRRPVTPAELGRLVGLVEGAVIDDEPFEAGVRTALAAILSSPHFLFHVETRARPHDASSVEDLSPYELAARTSYFLWGSLPDAALSAEAARGTLRSTVGAEARRMLKDPRAGALVDGFADQWLTLRRLATAHPDRERFPTVDERLLEDMLHETEMFFEAVMTEDRSILDFVDGPFTFVNERLAKHYGIAGVSGDRFRRVALDGVERAGLLTQASILTVTSYPTRTSPVRRGKWLLEQVLGQTVPPPPPGAGDLNDAGRRREGRHAARADGAPPQGPVVRGVPPAARPAGVRARVVRRGRRLAHARGRPPARHEGDASRRALVLDPGRAARGAQARPGVRPRVRGEAPHLRARPGTHRRRRRGRPHDRRTGRGPGVPFLRLRRRRRRERAVHAGPGRSSREGVEVTLRIPRRTFLRGVGAAMALPLLDAMCPGAVPGAFAGAPARGVAEAARLPLRAQRRQRPRLDPEGRGRRLRALADARAPRQDEGVGARALRAGTASGRGERRRARRPRAGRGHVPHLDAGRQDERGQPPRRDEHRPGRRRADRERDALPLARARLRPGRDVGRVRLGLLVRVLEQPRVAHADVAAREGDRPAGRLRPPLR